MILYDVVGLKSYSFNDSVTGKNIQGTKFFCVYEDTNDQDCNGYKTISFNVSRFKLNTYLPQVGDKLYISWADKRNFKVDNIEHVVN